jgi:hypothetical protein
MSKKTNKIAQEIILYKLSGDETLEDLHDIFRKIMKKHKIAKTTPVYNDEGKKIAENGDRFEWTMYKTLWFSRIDDWLTWRELFGKGAI